VERSAIGRALTIWTHLRAAESASGRRFLCADETRRGIVPPSKRTLSTRLATLQSIKSPGKPVMESQLVVDQPESDEDGFLVVTFDSGSVP